MLLRPVAGTCCMCIIVVVVVISLIIVITHVMSLTKKTPWQHHRHKDSYTVKSNYTMTQFIRIRTVKGKAGVSYLPNLSCILSAFYSELAKTTCKIQPSYVKF